MTNDQTTDAYLRTRVMTASSEELRLLLLDGSIRFARQGRRGIVDNNHEQAFEGISQCRAIVAELFSSVRPEVDPELGERVKSVYGFLFRELAEIGVSSADNRVGRLDRVIELLEYERQTWVLLMEQLKRDEADATGSPASAQPSPDADRPALSIEA